MRPRFSIRWLLLFVTLVAIACGIFIFPTLRAGQLVSAVNNGDFSELDSLEMMKANWQYKKYSYKDLKTQAVLHPRTWRDVFQFRRRVSINMWPPANTENLSPMSATYVFVHLARTRLGGETWE